MVETQVGQVVVLALGMVPYSYQGPIPALDPSSIGQNKPQEHQQSIGGATSLLVSGHDRGGHSGEFMQGVCSNSTIEEH